ncbi:MAG: hypothetical protein RLZZ214_3539 [Verrucomicrobiota bacterium]|jgi:hypothetical protein
MKSDGIKRSVRANRHDRVAGDAPSIGRVARMPGTGLPRKTRGKRRKGDGVRPGRRRALLTATLVLAGLAVAVVGGIFWMWLRPKMLSGENEVRERQAQVELPVRVASKFPSPSEEEALALVKHALAIREPSAIPGFFRPGAASPEEIVRYLGNLESVDGPISGYDWLSSMDVNRLWVDGVLVKFKGGDTPQTRLALLTPDAGGKWKIDFDAFARTVKPAWSEILEKRADPALVRVYAAVDSYYNGPFQDDNQWICYGMASPDIDGILTGYCKAGSPQAAALKWIFSKESKLNRVTLELRRVEGAGTRQFEISRVLAEDWVMGAAAFDTGF